MPYFRDDNLDKNKDEDGNVQVSSSGVQADPSGNPNGNQGQMQASRSGSNFQNLDAYLKNNDAAGAGQQFGANVQKSVDEARKTVDESVNQVKNQIGSGAGPATQEQINAAIKSAGAGTTADQAKQYQDWTNQMYQGPHSLAESPDAQNRIEGGISSAQQKAKLAGTESGRFALLDQFYGRPSYNFGEKALDNMLVQRGGGFDPQAAQEQATQLGVYGDQQAKSVQDAAAQRAAQYDQSKALARSSIGLQDDGTIKGGALGDLQSQIDARVKAENDSENSRYSNLQSDLSDNVINQDTRGITGLKSGIDTYGLNLAAYLNKPNEATAANSATSDEYAKYLALSQLAGTNPQYLSEANKAKAGSYAPEESFNMAGFNKDVSAKKAEYETAAKQPVYPPGYPKNLPPISVNEIPNAIHLLMTDPHFIDSGYGHDLVRHDLDSPTRSVNLIRQLEKYQREFNSKYGVGNKTSYALENKNGPAQVFQDPGTSISVRPKK